MKIAIFQKVGMLATRYLLYKLILLIVGSLEEFILCLLIRCGLLVVVCSLCSRHKILSDIEMKIAGNLLPMIHHLDGNSFALAHRPFGYSGLGGQGEERPV